MTTTFTVAQMRTAIYRILQNDKTSARPIDTRIAAGFIVRDETTGRLRLTGAGTAFMMKTEDVQA